MRDPLNWLENELPLWRREGFLQPGQEERILDYYRNRQTQAPRSLMVILFGIIGALLIGGGLMLIIAHNWPSWPRSVRGVVSVAPMLVCQILAAWVLKSRAGSTAWKESLGLVWVCAISAGIALVGQTYHISGSVDRFMITWMLLSLPVVYLMNSVSAMLIYVTGCTQWSFVASHHHGVPQFYWLLLGAVLPVMISWNRNNPSSGKATVSRWCFIVAAFWGLMATIDIDQFKVGYLVFSLYAGLIWLAGIRYESSTRSAWMRPGIHLGGLGLAILFYMMTINHFWHENAIGGLFRILWQQMERSELVVVIGLAAAFTTYWILAWQKRDAHTLVWGSIPVYFLILSNIPIAARSPLMMSALVSLGFFVMGVWTLRSGVRNDHLGRVNTGMLMVCALVVTRFFDANLPILMRALVFMFIGAAFLVVNIRMTRRRREAKS